MSCLWILILLLYVSVCLRPLKNNIHTNPKRDFFCFLYWKNTHKIYIKMRNTQENWITIAKHGNHFLTALHNELVNKIRISMIETLGAASRREYLNLICVECVAYCSYLWFCASKWLDRPKFWNETFTSSKFTWSTSVKFFCFLNMFWC